MNKYSKSYGSQTQELSHGNTAEELDAVHDAQMRNRKIATVNGNVDKTYQLPESEQGSVHFRHTIPQFDPGTGKDNSVSKIVKQNPNMFSLNEKRNYYGSVKVDILHDPRKLPALRDNTGSFQASSVPVSVKKKKLSDIWAS